MKVAWLLTAPRGLGFRHLGHFSYQLTERKNMRGFDHGFLGSGKFISRNSLIRSGFLTFHIWQWPHATVWHDKVWKSDGWPKGEIWWEHWSCDTFQAWSATTSTERPKKTIGSLFQERCALANLADLISWIPGSGALKTALAATSAIIISATGVSGAFWQGLSKRQDGDEDENLYESNNAQVLHESRDSIQIHGWSIKLTLNILRWSLGLILKF